MIKVGEHRLVLLFSLAHLLYFLFTTVISETKLSEFVAEMEKHLLPLHYNLTLLLAFRAIRPSEFNFKTVDHFYRQRQSKTRLRHQNRDIYTFMCEIKTLHEALEAKKKKSSAAETQAKPKSDGINVEQLQKNKYVERYIREAKLAGLALKDREKVNMFNLINTKLRDEQVNFFKNWSIATGNFHSSIISPQFLDCLPDHVITQIDHHNTEAIYQSFLRYCPDQNLRKDFWLAYNSRASPFFESKVNNFLIIEKIRDYREKKAVIFGYENFAQMAIDLRGPGGQTMAGSVENVRAFINGLASRSDARFLANLGELTEFATRPRKPVTKAVANMPSAYEGLIEPPIEGINLWDLKYFERLFLRETYGVESRAVRVFFPLDKVLQGLLEFAEQLFNIKIVEMKDDNKRTWSDSSRHYKVFDNRQRSMGELGSFYFDPFQREPAIFVPIGRSESQQTKPAVFWMMNFRADAQSIVEQMDRQEMQTRKELLNFYQVIDLFGNVSCCFGVRSLHPVTLTIVFDSLYSLATCCSRCCRRWASPRSAACRTSRRTPASWCFISSACGQSIRTRRWHGAVDTFKRANRSAANSSNVFAMVSLSVGGKVPKPSNNHLASSPIISLLPLRLVWPEATAVPDCVRFESAHDARALLEPAKVHVARVDGPVRAGQIQWPSVLVHRAVRRHRLRRRLLLDQVGRGDCRRLFRGLPRGRRRQRSRQRATIGRTLPPNVFGAERCRRHERTLSTLPWPRPDTQRLHEAQSARVKRVVVK